MMEVFKLVSITPDRVMRSAFVRAQHFVVTYVLGEVVTPPTNIPVASFLMAFQDRQEARSFGLYCLEGAGAVLRCEADVAFSLVGEHQVVLAGRRTSEDAARSAWLKDFWEHVGLDVEAWKCGDNSMADWSREWQCGRQAAPVGTVFCKSLTPLEIVEQWL
jgi:hypothetical protein